MKPYITSVWLRSDPHRSHETDMTFPEIIKIAIELSKKYPNVYYEEVHWGGNDYFAFFKEKVENAEEIVSTIFGFEMEIQEKLEEIGRKKIDILKDQLLQVKENQKHVIKEDFGIEIHIDGETATVILENENGKREQEIQTENLKTIVRDFETEEEEYGSLGL